MPKPINRIYIWLAAAALGLFSILALEEMRPASISLMRVELETTQANSNRNYFANLGLEAKAAIVFAPDQNKILFAKNSDAPLPIASLTKIMTVLAAERTLAAPSPAGEVLVQFNDRSWPLSNLVDYALVLSSNTAAVAIATAASTAGHPLVQTMNDLATELGLTKTHFENSTGLDLTSGEPGGVSSAIDLAHLFAYTLKNQSELLSATRYPEIEVAAADGIRYRIINTNKIIGGIPGLLASKTGYTEVAQGSLAVISNRGLNEPIIFIVLGSSYEGRFTDMQKLISAAYTYDY